MRSLHFICVNELSVEVTEKENKRFSYIMKQASPLLLHGQKDPALMSQRAHEPLKLSQR